MPSWERWTSPNSARPRTLSASIRVGAGPPVAMQGPSRCGPVWTPSVLDVDQGIAADADGFDMDGPDQGGTAVNGDAFPFQEAAGRRQRGRYPRWCRRCRASADLRPPDIVARMPMTEAAGPEKIDCTGASRARDSGMVPPSALRMLTSAWRSKPLRLAVNAPAKLRKVRQTAEL